MLHLQIIVSACPKFLEQAIVGKKFKDEDT